MLPLETPSKFQTYIGLSARTLDVKSLWANAVEDLTFRRTAQGPPAQSEQKRQLYDSVLLVSLCPVFLSIAVVIFVATAYRAYYAPLGTGLLTLAVGLTVAGIFLQTRRLIMQDRIPVRWAHPLAAMLSTVGYLFVLYNLVSRQEQFEAVRFVGLTLLIIIASALFLRLPWLLGMMLFIYVSWTCVNLAIGLEIPVSGYFILYPIIGVTSLANFAARKQAISQMIEAQQENERQNSQLVDALERAHRSEAELYVERRIADQIVDTMGQGLLLLNDAGTVEYINHAAEEILGRSIDDMHDKLATDVIHDSDGKPHERLQLVEATDCPMEDSFEAFIEHPDGSKANVLISTVSRPGGGTIVTLTDMTVRKQIEAKLERLAHFDALTGLANRTNLIEKIEVIAADSRSHPRQLALLFLDLDGFKNINDTFGHAVGDQVLNVCAKRIQSCIRRNDTAARFGGDEFVILLVDIAGPAEAIDVAERVIASIKQPFVLPNGTQQLSGSVGISFAGSQDVDAEEMIRKADTAMYEAKRNRFANAVIYQEARVRSPLTV